MPSAKPIKFSANVRHVAVIDIGKTNAKLALVEMNSLSEIAVRKMANTVRQDGPYPHFDVEALWQFILEGLAAYQRDHGVDAISVTTHGACAALIDASGDLALPVLDYEFDGYGETANRYAALRPPFAETGSPHLPLGLNLGAQIFWQQQTFPEAFSRTIQILTYPQYWSFRLTGVAANEVTSLGCHTDLWSPVAHDYSSLVDKMGWRKLMAPLQRASQSLGFITADVTNKTGLKPETHVACGIHDSNASLVPHLLVHAKPFSVISTGTWVISMAIGGKAPVLDERRDTLMNVNAFAEAVPSARFMGGREFQLVMAEDHPTITPEDVEAVLGKGIFLLPSIVQGSGPFADRKSRWIGEPTPAERQVAASFYLALVTATCLDLIGADGETIVEGPFSSNPNFLDMLAIATGRPTATSQNASTGTTIGAALLLAPEKMPKIPGTSRQVSNAMPLLAYAKRWRELLG
jgi:sugar (pentulose or hexulose) kinase